MIAFKIKMRLLGYSNSSISRFIRLLNNLISMQRNIKMSHRFQPGIFFIHSFRLFKTSTFKVQTSLKFMICTLPIIVIGSISPPKVIDIFEVIPDISGWDLSISNLETFRETMGKHIKQNCPKYTSRVFSTYQTKLFHIMSQV